MGSQKDCDDKFLFICISGTSAKNQDSVKLWMLNKSLVGNALKVLRLPNVTIKDTKNFDLKDCNQIHTLVSFRL